MRKLILMAFALVLVPVAHADSMATYDGTLTTSASSTAIPDITDVTFDWSFTSTSQVASIFSVQDMWAVIDEAPQTVQSRCMSTLDSTTVSNILGVPASSALVTQLGEISNPCPLSFGTEAFSAVLAYPGGPISTINFATTTVPEPSTVLLTITGALLLVVKGRSLGWR